MEFKIITVLLTEVFPFLLSAVPAAAQNAENILASGARDSETIMLHYHKPDGD